jgi:PIN domain nuclease of toxin-antitoxin system
VRALLDTHTLLWWASDDESLTPVARSAIANKTNDVFLSAASTWEMAIKIAIGKLTLSLPLASFVLSQISQHEFKPLPITHTHTYQVRDLPPFHRDPFDRLLIAQAMVENLVILTADEAFQPYGVAILW